jgi:SAM-dependent methyltransferase
MTRRGRVKVRVRAAKRLMRLREQRIDLDVHDLADGGAFQELFDHPDVVAASPDRRRELGLLWAEHLYRHEVAHPLDEQLGVDLVDLCRDARMLDLGCYIGGRTARWVERYAGREIHGVDVDARFLDVAEAFAKRRDVEADFRLGAGEALPYPDGFFDVILTQDTFEHVRDLGRVLAECRRVLRDGGHLVVTFPPFFAPHAHHLDLATRTPFVHWLFSPRVVFEAYFELLDERGAAAEWYRREEREPLPHERGYSINGTTAAAFRRMIAAGWEVEVDTFRDRPSRSGRPVVRRLVDTAKLLDVGPLRELTDVGYVLRRR